jgi:rhodanese-related sulfurtransferase
MLAADRNIRWRRTVLASRSHSEVRAAVHIVSARDLVAKANSQVETLSVEQAKALLGDGSVRFLDVREPAEWERGRVPGAVHVPRGLLEFKADPSLEAYYDSAIDPARRLVCYCASGGRSALAAKTLKDMGYENVANMLGGFTAWSEARLPVEL